MIIKQHERAKPYEKRKAVKTEQLWNEFVGNVLAMELEDVLSEPLDADQFNDLTEGDKARMREAM